MAAAEDGELKIERFFSARRLRGAFAEANLGHGSRPGAEHLSTIICI
jgi:hypothetical protein